MVVEQVRGWGGEIRNGIRRVEVTEGSSTACVEIRMHGCLVVLFYTRYTVQEITLNHVYAVST